MFILLFLSIFGRKIFLNTIITNNHRDCGLRIWFSYEHSPLKFTKVIICYFLKEVFIQNTHIPEEFCINFCSFILYFLKKSVNNFQKNHLKRSGFKFFTKLLLIKSGPILDLCWVRLLHPI